MRKLITTLLLMSGLILFAVVYMVITMRDRVTSFAFFTSGISSQSTEQSQSQPSQSESASPSQDSLSSQIQSSSSLINTPPSSQKSLSQSSSQFPVTQSFSQAPVTSSGATNLVMIFRAIPSDANEAKTQAGRDAKTLQSFSSRGLVPVVILEPNIARASEFASTGFWSAVDMYYSEIKSKGVNDAQLGEQVIFSEANTHQVWGYSINPNASTFVANTNRYASILKTHFPRGKTAILLNNNTFTVEDEGWENPIPLNTGSYLSGLRNIDKFYLQGLPWVSITNPSVDILDAAKFTDMGMLKQAVNAMKPNGTREFGLNTGALVAQRRGNRTLTDDQIRSQVEGIVREITNFKNSTGVSTTVNFFIENKYNVAEGKDWNFAARLGENYYQDVRSRLAKSGIIVSEFRKNQ